MAGDLTWPTERMSKFIDVSPQYLGQLVQKGVIPKAERGRYNPFTVTVAYIRWLRDQRVKPDDTEETKKAREAKEARYQQQIDESAMVANDRALQEGNLIFANTMRDIVADAFTKSVQIVRQWPVTEKQKKEMIKQLSELKLSPRKVVEFK